MPMKSKSGKSSRRQNSEKGSPNNCACDPALSASRRAKFA
jgi:hypothetical protein